MSKSQGGQLSGHFGPGGIISGRVCALHQFPYKTCFFLVFTCKCRRAQNSIAQFRTRYVLTTRIDIRRFSSGKATRGAAAAAAADTWCDVFVYSSFARPIDNLRIFLSPSSLPSHNSDPGPLSRLSSPPPSPIQCAPSFHREYILQPSLPSSTRIELHPPTLLRRRSHQSIPFKYMYIF